MRCLISLGLLLILGSICAEEKVSFTQEPKVTKKGNQFEITFSVNKETDVAIYIENKNNEVIRHLVAGRLGKNAPLPLKPGLTQKVIWDGKANYKKEAKNGPFKVRIGLGLNAKYEKVVRGYNSTAKGIYSVVSHNNRLFMMASVGGSVFDESVLMEYDPDGIYVRTLKPFPSNLPYERTKSFKSIILKGKPSPSIFSERLQLYPGVGGRGGCSSYGLTISPDGKNLAFIFASNNYKKNPFSTAIIDQDGGSKNYLVALTQLGDEVGPFVVGIKKEPSLLEYSSDGKFLFLCGIRKYKEKVMRSAIYKISLSDRSKATLFFGDPKVAGNGDSKLNYPLGMSSDGKGKLFIADHANNRIVVIDETTGKYISEIPVDKPLNVHVNKEDGSLYASSGKKNSKVFKILKFKSAKSKTHAYETKIMTTGWKNKHSFAILKTKENKTLLYCGTRAGTLVSIEDSGEKFLKNRYLSRDQHSNGKKGQQNDVAEFESYNNIVVDRNTKEVYACVRGNGMRWLRYKESTDKYEFVNWTNYEAGRDSGGVGLQIVPNPDGNLYSLSWPYNFKKWNRMGGKIPFDKRILASTDLLTRVEVAKYLRSPNNIKRFNKQTNNSCIPVSMTENPHTLGVRWSDGHIFIFSQTNRERTPKILREFLPNGTEVSKTPIIWQVSDTVVGPKFDAAGNIYIADAIKPKGWTLPKDLKEAFIKGGIKDPDFRKNKFTHKDKRVRIAVHFYGSIVKFSPKGGKIDYKKVSYSDAMSKIPYGNKVLAATPNLPADMPTLKAFYNKAYPWPNLTHEVTTTGAEWIHSGVGHMGPFECNCQSITFDVDEFGRSFFPDFHQFQIRVIDTNGNAITNFGSYGNADSRGKDSWVIDPKTGKLRPPVKNETLKSPFAKPDIALAWPMGIGVTDNFAYIGDSINRRLLKVKLYYEVEKTTLIK